RVLIATLPEVATRPDMTALWESAMRRIADSQLSLAAFLEAVMRQLRDLINRGRALRSLDVPGARRCPAPACTGYLRRRKGPTGVFWSCTRYPDCRETAEENGELRPTRGRGRKRGTGTRQPHSESANERHNRSRRAR